MHIRPCLAILRNNRILLLRYLYSSGEVFCIPGGGVQEGESVKETLRREFLEELSVRVRIDRLAMVYEMKPKEHLPQTLHLIFKGRLASQPVKINPEHTSAKEAVWLDLSLLKDIHLYPDVSSYLLNGFQDVSSEIPFVEEGRMSSWVY